MPSTKAFWLLAFVIAFELTLAAGVVFNCAITKDHVCSEGKVARSLESIMAQCFALYAAEIGISQTKK